MVGWLYGWRRGSSHATTGKRKELKKTVNVAGIVLPKNCEWLMIDDSVKITSRFNNLVKCYFKNMIASVISIYCNLEDMASRSS